jgi:hypothetical protein
VVVGHDLPDEIDPFLYGEQRVFCGVASYCYDDFIENAQSPVDDVKVTVGDGIE